MLHGLKIVGPKLQTFVSQAQELTPERRLAIHCWRGGQRSQSMAWLFRQAGFDVVTLDGGYKNYRQFVLHELSQRPCAMIVIGGQTGTGKTKILKALQQQGEQIIDLEALAHHKGSAFGAIGESPQPTVEQFENELLETVLALQPQRRVWIENESRSIGRVFIPDGFWERMKAAPLFNVEIPLDCRIQNLVDDYTGVSQTELAEAFRRIDKKLGGQQLKAALDHVQSENYAAAAAIALYYYDKTYGYGLENNPSPAIHKLRFPSADPDHIAAACRRLADTTLPAIGKSVTLEAD